MCNHQPVCPNVAESGCTRARVVADRMLQGWSLLCNGVIVFDDGYALVPGAAATPAPRHL